MGQSFAEVTITNRIVLKLRKENAQVHVGGGRTRGGMVSHIFFAANPPRMRDGLFEDSEWDVAQTSGEGSGSSWGTGRKSLERVEDVGGREMVDTQHESGPTIQEVGRSRME